MVDKISNDTLKKLNPVELRDALIGVTVGGTKGSIDLEKKGLIFAEYVTRAFPAARIITVKPISTASALNSVSGIIEMQFPNEAVQSVFGKVHIESNTRTLNPLGAEREYAMAEMLADAGWPVIEPLAKSDNTDYPLLLYPVIEEVPLFDKLEASYTFGELQITDEELSSLEEYNRKIGEKEVAEIRIGTRQEAIDAPVQTLLLKRFEQDGRIDQWYTADTNFKLPGMKEGITWNNLLNKKWNINGKDYKTTLRQIIDQARKSLAFDDEETTYLTISHGDDHAGNVRLSNPPVVFDPAFAGWNPAALDLKALAHTGFLPMAAMYYPPKDLNVEYQIENGKIFAITNLKDLPMYETQEKLAKQIIDTRVILLLRAIKEKGGNIEKEKQRVQSGLAACALLTVNIAQLLEQNDGRAVGLLPMAIMFSELKGLSILEYLNEQIDKITI